MSRAARAALFGLLLAALAPVWGRAQVSPLSFTGDPLPDATLGESYVTEVGSLPVVIGVEGGTPPYVFSLIDGRLPAGITLASNGTLSGVPTACGAALFQVQVRDAAGAFINGTLLLEVVGDGDLTIPAPLTPTVEAGSEVVLPFVIGNVGCNSVPFHLESEDFGFLPPPAATTARRSGLATLRRAGLPMPALLGSISGARPRRSEGWSIDAEGRLVDPEGNAADASTAPLRPTGVVQTEAGELAILYVNESATEGEVQRLTGLGFTVVESLVPMGLDDQTLDAFDVVWLTAATDSAFPSRTALRRFVWEGGGLIIEQVEIGGVIPLLPPGYALSALPGRPIGNNNDLQFLAAALLDPLTAGLDAEELPANFDTTSIAASGGGWTFLAAQRDLSSLGTLAVAEYGSGLFIYVTGNLGTNVVPGANNGSDLFVTRLVERAASGGARLSCPWLTIGDAVSSSRPETQAATTVEPNGTDLVTVPLSVDARGLPVGTHQCQVSLFSVEDQERRHDVDLILEVVTPVDLRLGAAVLPRAEPGQPYGATLPAYGGTPPYLFTLVDGSLPAGLVFDPAAGTVFGTPTDSGIFRPRFRLTDAGTGLDEETFRIESGLVITTETLPDAVLGGIYVEAVSAAGGSPPYEFALAPAVDYTLPAATGTPEADLCTTTDLGGDLLQTDCTLDAGPYQVVFLNAAGRISPDPLDVVVPDGGLATANGVYLTPGSITVTINIDFGNYQIRSQTPDGLVTLPGTGLTTTFSALRPGEWTVTFLPSEGFATPPDQTGTLTDGGTLAFDATFVNVVPPPALAAADADVGFGQGTLRVLTNVPGARAEVVANVLPSLLEIIVPNDIDAEAEAGASAALVGRFLTLRLPSIFPGKTVPFAIVVTDSDGDRFRQPYAPVVHTFPSISSISPNTLAGGMESSLQIVGANLRATAVPSFGPGVTLSNLEEFVSTGGTEGLTALVQVDPAVATGDRDLIYTDPELTASNFSSTIRRPSILEIFPTLERVDMNGSGRVDGFDLARLARTFGLATSHPEYDPAADLTRDDAVDGDDLHYFAIDFGRIRLTIDQTALPPAPATLGVPYVYGIPLLGGNVLVQTRQIAGALPDGITAAVEVVSGGTEPPELVLRGIPAEVGSFPLTFQAVDGFFSVDVASFVLTVNP